MRWHQVRPPARSWCFVMSSRPSDLNADRYRLVPGGTMTTEQQIPDEVSQNAMASSTATGPVVVLRDVVKTFRSQCRSVPTSTRRNDDNGTANSRRGVAECDGIKYGHRPGRGAS